MVDFDVFIRYLSML